MLACAERPDGFVAPDAVKTAAAVELLHLATLVHDDVIDNAKTRRGILALHKKFGVKPAVLCGDYLLCLALETVSELTPREDRKNLLDRALPRYLTDVLAGEMRQDSNNRNYALTESEYFDIISGKTASLFEASFYAGFLHSDEPEDLKAGFQAIGRDIGLIFQLSDDCADYEATAGEVKKPVLSDFKSGVVTLPLIYALRVDAGLKEKIPGRMRPEVLRKSVVTAGGVRYTRERISQLHSKTHTAISSLPVLPGKRERLTELLDCAAGMPVSK